MKDTLTLILAGGSGDGLGPLTYERSVAAVPFAGKFRIIDFCLSNCAHSGLTNVAILAQYRPHSLRDHIGIGRPWDMDRARHGLRILQPYLRAKEGSWYVGTADAVYQNLNIIEEARARAILVLMGDQVYKMDYRPLIAFHLEHRADATLGMVQVPREEVSRYGIMTVDDEHRVRRFQEKPAVAESTSASMGVYVFAPETLVQRLLNHGGQRPRDFGRDILPALVEEARVFAYPFEGYWRDVGVIDAYWNAQMDLLAERPALDLLDKDWPILTRSEERSAARIERGAVISQSLVCHGCRIEGTVERSILSPGVRVGPGAVVRDSILFTDTVVEADARVEHTIIDKEVLVAEGCRVGSAASGEQNQLVILPKRTRLEPGQIIASRASAAVAP